MSLEAVEAELFSLSQPKEPLVSIISPKTKDSAQGFNRQPTSPMLRYNRQNTKEMIKEAEGLLDSVSEKDDA